MNWTHRFTIAGWNNNWYLIDVSKPLVVANESRPDALLTVYDGWFEDCKREKSFQIEELIFSLENE